MRVRSVFCGIILLPFLSVACTKTVRVMSSIEPAKDHTSSSVALNRPALGADIGLGGQPAEPLDEEAVALVAPPSWPLGELASFYEALDELAQHKRQESVRVMWMGDSHTAADFMTDVVRNALQGAFSGGGPGFVRLGMDGYRHAQVQLTVSGKWRKAPILPAQRTRVLDGVFGYGGVRTIPLSGASVKARASAKYKGTLRWTISYRLEQNAAFAVRLGTQEQILRAAPAAQDIANKIQYQSFEGAAEQELVVRHVAGSPEIFGAYCETVEPGVVLDTVGINGARAATALAWEPEQFAESVQARDVDLLVLAYGTNEVFDKTNPARYQEHLEEIVKLVRNRSPELPCWVIGAPDAATDDGRSRVRVAQVNEQQLLAAKNQGCAFTSAYELMGGEGSFSRWMSAKPPLARGDHIHLTIAGYQQLGQLFANQLLGETSSEHQP